VNIRKLLIGIVAVGFVPSLLALLIGFLNFYFPLADSFSHFRLHLSILTAIALFLFFILKAWSWSLGGLAATVFGIMGLGPALPFFELEPIDGPNLRLIQFNTLFNNVNPELSAKWIADQEPDVVALQEVSANTMSIFDDLSQQMPSQVFCKFTAIGGVAVLSTFPKVSEKCVEGSGLVWMQVNANGKPLTFASVHLHWPYPYRQWQQMEKLKTEFAAMPRPVILAGDFNAAPWSEAIKHLSAETSTEPLPGLRLTLRLGAFGFGPIPMLPVDHILAPLGTNVQSVHTGPQIGSDHLPIFASIGLP
jgi:endonuclease/exonuclease/phosphatase (EEP) superfamily protein YafD